MEAASPQSPARDLGGEKAQRIVDAMRASVAARGIAGSTFDRVAREASVSRGLLHYYFASKERLLVEVVRRDTQLRIATLDAALADAHTADDFIVALVRSLESLVEEDPGFVTLVFELFSAARRNEEIAAEVAELTRVTRAQVADRLRAKQEEGVVQLHTDPEAAATILFVLADGIAMRMLIAPDADWRSTLRAGEACARALLT